jgi:hypothetical protein
MRDAYKILIGKLEWKRPHERPSRTVGIILKAECEVVTEFIRLRARSSGGFM